MHPHEYDFLGGQPLIDALTASCCVSDSNNNGRVVTLSIGSVLEAYQHEILVKNGNHAKRTFEHVVIDFHHMAIVPQSFGLCL